jgi:hypothetical protein
MLMLFVFPSVDSRHSFQATPLSNACEYESINSGFSDTCVDLKAMSNLTDNSRSSIQGSSNKVNSILNGNSRRIIRKEKINFPVEDPRLSRSAGNCYVEKDDVLEDMLDDDALERTRAIRACQTSNRPCSKLNDHSLGSTSHRSRQKGRGRDDLDAHQLSAPMMKSAQKQSQKVQQKKDALYSTLVLDISESMNLLDSIDQNLYLIEETKRNKTRRQFEEWNSQVHGSIQVSISFQQEITTAVLSLFFFCNRMRKVQFTKILLLILTLLLPFCLDRWISRNKLILLIPKN